MPEEPSRSSLPVAIAAVAVVAISAASALYVFRSVRAIPGEALQGARQLMDDARGVAAAFRTGTATLSFASYATEVKAGMFLQFATLSQVEIFERKDEATLFWGQLALPEVIVEARAPVEYTYYLDLKAPWSFALDGGVVHVTAPPVAFNTPAVDASAIRYEVRKGSILRDEASVVEKLKLGLTELARRRAREHIALVRDTGRRQTEEFVETWLRSRFPDGAAFRAKVRFQDEKD